MTAYRTLRFTLLIGATAFALSACKTNNAHIDSITSAGSNLFTAATLSDADMVKLTNEACQAIDAKSAVAPASSPYTKRLQKIVQGMETTVNGQTINYKVYLVNDVNAFAMANGCVRVYAGLMNQLTDDEVRGVIGHEIGHVALGHTKRKMQAAYTTVAARNAADAAGGTVAALNQTQLGDLGHAFISAQYSQSLELEADNYGYDSLKAKGFKREGLATSFEKIGALEGSRSVTDSLFSSHPPSPDRVKNIRDRIAADGGDSGTSVQNDSGSAKQKPKARSKVAPKKKAAQ